MSTANEPAKCTLDLNLVAGLDPKRCDKRIRASLRAKDQAKYCAAFHLADLVGRGGHLELGATSFRHYARMLKRPLSTLHELYRVGRVLLDLAVLREAAASGLLKWTQLRLVSSVATLQTVAAWVEWAAEHDLKELRERVKTRRKDQLPTDPRPRGVGTPSIEVATRLAPKLWRHFQHGRELQEAEQGRAIGDGEYLELLIRAGLGAVPEPAEPQLALEYLGPLVVPEERDEVTSPELREQVLARDEYLCRCCKATKRLHAHHQRRRCHGGATALENLLTLCDRCHSAVHAGFLFVTGDVSETLTFLDRHGRELETPEPCVPVCAEVSQAEGGRRWVEFQDLPAELDADAWVALGPRFEWSDRAGEGTFSPGEVRVPRAEQDAPAVEATIPASGGTRLGATHGHDRVRRRLTRSIVAARKRGEPLRSLLLTGPAGLGKTYLAHATAADLDAPLVELMAPTVHTPEKLIRTLTSLASGSVLFLDELHSLPRSCAELLYQALDGGVLTLSVRCGIEQKVIRVKLRPFTLVGATTDEDLLLEPLRTRLVSYRLEHVGRRDLEALLSQGETSRGLSLTEPARSLLAGAARGTPRQALKLLDEVHDSVVAAGDSVDRVDRVDRVDSVDLEQVEQVLAELEIDGEGLSAVDRHYLQVLATAGGRPLGASTLGARLALSRAQVCNVLEPFLLRQGLVEITPRGRRLLPAGRVIVVRATRAARAGLAA